MTVEGSSKIFTVKVRHKKKTTLMGALIEDDGTSPTTTVL
jgi:hypothetical protein